MKKILAIIFSISLILSAVSCSKKPESDTSSIVTEDSKVTSASKDPEITTDTSETPEVTTEPSSDPAPSETETGTVPESTTKDPMSADSDISELYALIKDLTGKRIAYAEALVQDYFEKGFYHSYTAMETQYGDDPNGRDIYYSYCYMQGEKGDFLFNRFIFTANEEYGNVYEVEFVNSNSQNDTSLKPSDYSQEDMRYYYSNLAKELTGCLGDPVDSQPLDEQDPGNHAAAVYDVGGGCLLRLSYDSSRDDRVVIKFSNPKEMLHFLEPGEGMGMDGSGELYYKEAEPGDIVQDEKTGYRYVKNQLQISCVLGTPRAKEKVEKICQELDAEIVGVIEMTGDFQIEFHQDKTYDELLDIAQKLKEQYYFIIRVDLNLAIEMGIADQDG